LENYNLHSRTNKEKFLLFPNKKKDRRQNNKRSNEIAFLIIKDSISLSIELAGIKLGGLHASSLCFGLLDAPTKKSEKVAMKLETQLFCTP